MQKGNYLFVLIWILGCSNNHYATYFTRQGHKVVYEYILEDCDTLLHGSKKEFYRNGKLCVVENYTYGRLNGEVTYYWPDGTKYIDLLFGNGKLLEQRHIWDTSGVIIDSFPLRYGKGKLNKYNSNRILVSSYSINESEYNGECKEFDNEGKLIQNYFYINGRKDGPAFFFENHHKCYTTYKSGERDGWLKAFDSLDRIYMVAKYKEGIIIDTSLFYNDTSWITPNTIIDRMMIYKNFTSITKEDSITLGIHSVFGYMSIMAKQPGIKIKAIEYDKKGTQLNVINYKNNLPI